MNKFVWFSNSSQESAELIASGIGADSSGKVPAKTFSGVAVSWGAKPADIFKWESRDFKAIFNDPRVVRPLQNKFKLFSTLAEKGFAAADVIEISGYSFASICEDLGESSFVVCRPLGGKATVVSNQQELSAAINDGAVFALSSEFKTDNRVRVFVANGKALFMLKKQSLASASASSKVTMLENNMPMAATSADVKDYLKQAFELGLVDLSVSDWNDPVEASGNYKHDAIAAVEALGLDFAAVDFCADTSAIINVVTTPKLVGLPHHALNKINNAISDWVATKTLTAKQALSQMIADVSEEEAKVLLDTIYQAAG